MSLHAICLLRFQVSGLRFAFLAYRSGLPPRNSIMPFHVSRRSFPLLCLLFFASVNQARSSAPSPWDDARIIVDDLKYDHLEQMRAENLERAQLPRQPWSGWYWPLYQGGLAYRYADPKFPQVTDWNVLSAYLLETLGLVSGPELSPAEKYDLLVGDLNFTLSRNMLSLANARLSNGSVPGWLGFCGGWANAAMNLPKPVHSVIVTAHDNRTQIEFRPTDLEALATLLWANGSVPYRMAGRLCQQVRIVRDASGRAIDPDCQDNNPATWHLSVVNQIGLSHRGLVIDADPSYQIWNHPVFSYDYKYFNPATELPAGSLEEAKIKQSDFLKDRFSAFRARNTIFLVGIEMQTTFMFFKAPSLTLSPSPPSEENETRTALYRYDLELDSSGKIIGGEWYSFLHPDVIWVASPGAHPLSIADSQLAGTPDWIRGEPIPEGWQEAAITAAAVTQPLARIVDDLLLWSNE